MFIVRHGICDSSIINAHTCSMKRLLPPAYQVRRSTRSSVSMPSQALEIPKSRTHFTGRSFTHVAVGLWNSLPDNIVGAISDMGVQSFKSRTHKYLLQS